MRRCPGSTERSVALCPLGRRASPLAARASEALKAFAQRVAARAPAEPVPAASGAAARLDRQHRAQACRGAGHGGGRHTRGQREDQASGAGAGFSTGSKPAAGAAPTRCPQSSPAKAPSQLHRPSLHAPCPLQSLAQWCRHWSHATPPHPPAHRQAAVAPPTRGGKQRPCPLQSSSHAGTSHAAPFHPVAHKQRPMSQTPWPLQRAGQLITRAHLPARREL